MCMPTFSRSCCHWTRYGYLALAAAAPMVMNGCAARTSSGVAGLEQQILEELRRDGVSSPSERSAPAESSPLPEIGPISLADLLAAAEVHNPDLAAARSEIGVAAGQAWQASLYPNPRLELSSEEIPFGAGGGIDQGITTLSVIQPIVLGDRLRAAVDAAEAEKAASRARVQMAGREIFGEIAQLHARLLAIRQADALYGELADLGNQTLDLARTRFEARAAPETEVIRPQIELYQIDLVRTRLAKEEVVATQQLSLLLGGLGVDVNRLSGEVTDNPPAVDLDAIVTLVRSEHPAL